MENIIGYIRVSTADQENSLEVQEKAIRQYCTFKNLNLIQIFIDEDISGFKPFESRPSGKLLALKLSPTINNIVAVKPDRLFRNLKDALITVDQWNENNISLHIVDMAGAQFNTKTAMGKLMFSTIIAYSEFERNITGERIKAVSANKKASGKVYCSGIFGYDNIDGTMIPNKSEQESITIIKNLTTGGHKPTFIAEFLNERGHISKTGSKFRQSTINYIIKNPIHN